MLEFVGSVSHLSRLRQGRWPLLLLFCLLCISACGSVVPAQAQPVSVLPVLAAPPQLAAYHVFVTDIGNGDLSELGRGTVNGGKSLHGLALSPDGLVYATDIADNRIDLFDVRGSVPRLLRTVAVGLYPVHVAFGPGGRFAYVTNFQDASVSIVDVAQGKVVKTIQTPAGPHGLTASPDGRFIYVACLNGQALAVIDTSNNSLAQTLTLPANAHPYSVVFGKEGRYLYITDNFFGRVLVVDTTRLYDPAHAVVGGAPAGQAPVLLAISSDGRRLYITNSGGNLTVLDIASNPTHPKHVATVPVGRSPHGVAVSPDGRYVVVANIVSGNLSVIDAASDTVVATIKGEKNPNDVLITQG
jgi:YVTN family beta-propeller protein